MPVDGTRTTANERTGSISRGLNRRRFLKAAGAGTATAAAGCLTGGGEKVKIGGVFLLSGIAEFLGRASQAGAKLGVDHVNEDGGINGKDVEIVFRDHENSADTANQHFRSLVQEEEVDAMIGLTSSGVTLATAPTVAELGVPFTLTDIGTPFITEHDSSYGDKAAGQDNIFRANANTSIHCYANAKFAMEELDGVIRVANMGPDYAYGHQCWEYFKAYAEGLGADFEFVASEFPGVGASDMTPQINSVMNADPDLVFTSFWGGDAVTFVQQATEQGLFDQVVSVLDTLGADPTVFEGLGTAMPEGVHFSSWYWHSAFDSQENKDFVNAFYDKYKGSDTTPIPSFTGPSTYSAIHMYKRAIENAGSTEPGEMIAELEGMEFTGPRGTWKLDADSHQATAPTNVGRTVHPDASGDDGIGPGVPYDGAGLTDVKSYTLDRSTAKGLLKGSGLPPGV